jgi:hypothetical protein
MRIILLYICPHTSVCVCVYLAELLARFDQDLHPYDEDTYMYVLILLYMLILLYVYVYI